MDIIVKLNRYYNTLLMNRSYLESYGMLGKIAYK